MGNVRVSHLWPSRTIPYDISRSLRRHAPDIVSNIQFACSEWNRLTRLEIRDLGDLFRDRNWINGVFRRGVNPFSIPRIKFVLSPGALTCNSHVGTNGGIQYIRCFNDWNTATLTHEIGHAIGLWHEHQRIDRDTHVIVSRSAISTALYNRNFRRKIPPWTMRHGNYDCNSVMHYDRLPRQLEIVPGGACGSSIGSDTISSGDVNAINYYYRRKPRY